MQLCEKKMDCIVIQHGPPSHVGENQEFMITVETFSICRLFM